VEANDEGRKLASLGASIASLKAVTALPESKELGSATTRASINEGREFAVGEKLVGREDLSGSCI
jgi:hypothetical protein